MSPKKNRSYRIRELIKIQVWKRYRIIPFTHLVRDSTARVKWFIQNLGIINLTPVRA